MPAGRRAFDVPWVQVYPLGSTAMSMNHNCHDSAHVSSKSYSYLAAESCGDRLFAFVSAIPNTWPATDGTIDDLAITVIRHDRLQEVVTQSIIYNPKTRYPKLTAA